MPHSPDPASQAVPARHVFVYGTLRRGERNDIARFSPPPAFVAKAEIAGTLYDLGSYPGAVLGGEGRIRGEVYRIAPEVEHALDLLEEVAEDDSGEYIKRERRVCDGSAWWDCLVYEIQSARVLGVPVLSGGDWTCRDSGQGREHSDFTG